jgi:DNA adenine methylase
VWVNDLYSPLYDFWTTLQGFPEQLRDHLLQFKNTDDTPEAARELFKISKDILNDPATGPFERAVRFYVVNKCSFSGLTESSSFSEQASISNFSVSGIERLPEYSKLIKNWKITSYSYEQLLVDDKSVFVYLDPPYDIKDNLYGNRGSMHKGFDHDMFANCCDNFKCSQLISYNNSNLVKERFKQWTVKEFAHTYTMRSTGSYTMDQAQRKELVLINYES